MRTTITRTNPEFTNTFIMELEENQTEFGPKGVLLIAKKRSYFPAKYNIYIPTIQAPKVQVKKVNNALIFQLESLLTESDKSNLYFDNT